MNWPPDKTDTLLKMALNPNQSINRSCSRHDSIPGEKLQTVQNGYKMPSAYCLSIRTILNSSVRFENQLYYDKALPFGAATSCKTFERFSSFLQFCVRERTSSKNLIHYLDDVLGGARTTQSCESQISAFLACMYKLNVPLAEDKA